MKQKTSRNEKENFWHEQMEMANKFPGSFEAFCKAQGLSIHTFMYWRQKFSNENKKTKALIPSPFAQVAVEGSSPVVLQRALPEAAWLAELILHLQAGLV